MHNESDIRNRSPRDEAHFEQVRVYTIPSLSDLMEAGFERYAPGLFPMPKGIMRNPMFSKSAVYQPMELLATVLRTARFDEIEYPQHCFKLTPSGNDGGKIGARFGASFSFFAIKPSRRPHLVLGYAFGFLFSHRKVHSLQFAASKIGRRLALKSERLKGRLVGMRRVPVAKIHFDRFPAD